MIATRSTGWIGVDIGSHAVKLAQVERRKGRLRLAEALVIPRQQPWPEDDRELDPIASSEEIRSVLSLGGRFAGSQAAVVLSMAACDVHSCRLPADIRGDRCELVARELDSFFPDAATTREFDFWEAPSSGEAATGEANVIAFSVSRAWSHQVADDLAQSRLVGCALDALPLALARAVDLPTPGASASPLAVVDWGCRRATLCAVQGGRPLFVRCLRDAGFAGVIQRLCKHLSVTPEEAQKLLTEHGLPDRTAGNGDELSAVIEEIAAVPLNALVGELNRTIAFLRQQLRAQAPTRLLLLGGGANVRNVTRYLSDKVDLPLELWGLGAEGMAGNDVPAAILALMGPAVALSALAWQAS